MLFIAENEPISHLGLELPSLALVLLLRLRVGFRVMRYLLCFFDFFHSSFISVLFFFNLFLEHFVYVCTVGCLLPIFFIVACIV